MPTRPYDRGRDAGGAPIPAHCRIEHIAVGKEHGALPSRLHRPHPVRVPATSGGG